LSDRNWANHLPGRACRATQDAFGENHASRDAGRALGIDPGDLSGAENPDAVNEIRRLVSDRETPVDV
jgi:hypothetical protein